MNRKISTYEMGHTLGLNDTYDTNLLDRSIMYATPGSVDAFSSFGDWDIKNILYYYGGDYIDQ